MTTDDPVDNDIAEILTEDSSRRGYEPGKSSIDDWSDTLDDRDPDDWEAHYEPETWGHDYSDISEDEAEKTINEMEYEESMSRSQEFRCGDCLYYDHETMICTGPDPDYCDVKMSPYDSPCGHWEYKR